MIKEIGYDPEDKCFYLLTNCYKGRLGVYLVRFSEKDPYDYKFIL